MSSDGHAQSSPNVVVLPVERPITITPSEEKVPQSKASSAEYSDERLPSVQGKQIILSGQSKYFVSSSKNGVASLYLKPGQTIAPFLVTTSSGARCVVVINATDNPSIAKLKETNSGDGILIRNKDVFLPQIVDENGDDEMETDFNDEDGEKLLNREGSSCPDVHNYIAHSKKDSRSTNIEQQDAEDRLLDDGSFTDSTIKQATRVKYGDLTWRKANTIEYRNVQNVYDEFDEWKPNNWTPKSVVSKVPFQDFDLGFQKANHCQMTWTF